MAEKGSRGPKEVISKVVSSSNLRSAVDTQHLVNLWATGVWSGFLIAAIAHWIGRKRVSSTGNCGRETAESVASKALIPTLEGRRVSFRW